jgi:hypothetical protein
MRGKGMTPRSNKRNNAKLGEKRRNKRPILLLKKHHI